MDALLAAALAGLLATPHCAAMCGGFATACARPRAGLGAWHIGRLGTYAALGAFAGAFGAVLPGPAWLPASISALFLLWFAAALAGFAPQPAARIPQLTQIGARAARVSQLRWRLLFGAVNGLLPCGMVYVALSIAVATAQPLHGAAAMTTFGIMTLPGLTIIAFGARRFLVRDIRTRRILAAVILIAGMWSIVTRGVIMTTHTHADTQATQHSHNVGALEPH